MNVGQEQPQMKKEEATPLGILTRHSAQRSKAQSKREAGLAFQKLKE